MKIFVSFFLFCLSAFVWSAPWGSQEDFAEPALSGSPSATPSGVGARYLLPQVLEGKPVRVWVTSDDPALILLRGEEESEEKVAKYKRIVTENYARWFADPARIIRSSGREAEFADVLPVLDRGISVQFVDSKQNPDLIVSAVSLERLWRECPGAAGCYLWSVEGEWSTPRILLPKPNFWQQLITVGKLNPKRIGQHETGHSLGLADQYERARSDAHPVYHSAVADASMMNVSGSITCDDADGIINLIDLVQGSSRGGELGWRSLCKGNETHYVNGKPVTAGPYAIKMSENGKTWILQTFRTGARPVSEREFPLDLQGGTAPFALLKESVRERDAAGRAVFAQGPNGEEIYYSYIYDKRVRLVTYDGRVLLGEITKPQWRGLRSRKNSRESYFGEGGNISVVGWEKSDKRKNKEGRAFYITYNPSGVVTESLYLNFKKDGSLANPSDRDAARSMAAASYPMRVETEAFATGGAAEERRRSDIGRLLRNKQKEEALREWYLRQ